MQLHTDETLISEPKSNVRSFVILREIPDVLKIFYGSKLKEALSRNLG